LVDRERLSFLLAGLAHTLNDTTAIKHEIAAAKILVASKVLLAVLFSVFVGQICEARSSILRARQAWNKVG
jgi:hypothetical protein